MINRVYSQQVSDYTIHAQYKRTDDSHTYYDYWLTDSNNKTLIATYGGVSKNNNNPTFILIHGLFGCTIRKGDTDDEYFANYTPTALEWIDSNACEYLACDQSTLENDSCCRCGQYLYQADNWEYDCIGEELYICGDCK